MRRVVTATVVGLTVGAAAFASASAVTVNTGGNLGAGSTTVASCDTTGVVTSFTLGTFDTTAGYTVSAVGVSSIDSPACNGKSVSVTLSDVSDNSVGSGGPVTVATGATSVTVTLSAAVAASKIAHVYVVIA